MMPVLTKDSARRLLGLAACLLIGVLCLGVFVVHGDLVGQTLASAFVPGVSSDAAPPRADTTTVALPLSTREKGSTSGLYVAGAAVIERMEPMPTERLEAEIDEETLWLARCIFSETKRKEEQELVAWVIRNRVETAYRGKSSYKDVVLDPMQFSAFNPGTRTRRYYTSLTPSSRVPGWRTALTIAHEVRRVEASYRPFGTTTRHFYSQQSMVGGGHPAWATGLKPVTPRRSYEIEAHRFRFYAGIS